jgi:hypothetical protein
MEDVKINLQSRVAIGFNWHALVKMVMNFQAQKYREISRIA